MAYREGNKGTANIALAAVDPPAEALGTMGPVGILNLR